MVGEFDEMDEEAAFGKQRADELAVANELNLKRCMDVEGRYEQLLLAKERAINELKLFRDSSAKEIEALKNSESFLKKSLETISSNYNSLVDDLLELKVGKDNQAKLRRSSIQVRRVQVKYPRPWRKKCPQEQNC